MLHLVPFDDRGAVSVDGAGPVSVGAGKTSSAVNLRDSPTVNPYDAEGCALRGLILVAVTVVTVGCTTARLDERWVRSDTNLSQATRDDWECRRAVTDVHVSWAPGPTQTPIGGAADGARAALDQETMDRAYARCMRARGYTRAR